MIEYDIRLPDGRSFSCRLDADRERDPLLDAMSARWTDLSYYKCPSCPLDDTAVKSCPLALDFQEILTVLKNLPSRTTVDVVVKGEDRWTFRNLTIEAACSSLFRYLMDTSSCPNLRGSQWQRQFHIPFASDKERAFLDVAHQLVEHLGQNTSNPSGITLADLRASFEIKGKTLQSFLKRCREGAREDSILENMLHHIEHVLTVTHDAASLASIISQLNKKTG